MKKKAITPKKTAPAKVKADGLTPLIAEVCQIITKLQRSEMFIATRKPNRQSSVGAA